MRMMEGSSNNDSETASSSQQQPSSLETMNALLSRQAAGMVTGNRASEPNESLSSIQELQQHHASLALAAGTYDPSSQGILSGNNRAALMKMLAAKGLQQPSIPNVSDLSDPQTGDAAKNLTAGPNDSLSTIGGSLASLQETNLAQQQLQMLGSQTTGGLPASSIYANAGLGINPPAAMSWPGLDPSGGIGLASGMIQELNNPSHHHHHAAALAEQQQQLLLQQLLALQQQQQQHQNPHQQQPFQGSAIWQHPVLRNQYATGGATGMNQFPSLGASAGPAAGASFGGPFGGLSSSGDADGGLGAQQRNVDLSNLVGRQAGSGPGSYVSSAAAQLTNKMQNKKRQQKDKPKRPLSAYNIFFKEERARILHSIPDKSGEGGEETGKGAQQGGKKRDRGDAATGQSDAETQEKGSSETKPDETGSSKKRKVSEGDKSDKAKDAEGEGKDSDAEGAVKHRKSTDSAPDVDQAKLKKSEDISFIDPKSLGTSAESRSKRKKSPHGKIGFEHLAKMIGQRWQNLSDDRMAYYKKLADADMKRYKVEMEEYVSRQREDSERKMESLYEEARFAAILKGGGMGRGGYGGGGAGLGGGGAGAGGSSFML